MKQEINAFDYAGHICQHMKKGILLTAKAGDKVNTMTIGWGKLGVVWSRPVFEVLVRESRYTKEFLDKTGEFTINVPMDAIDKNILSLCGTKSGRDLDKITQLGLTLEEPQTISVPGIKELPLTLECKVIYQQDQVLDAIDPDSRSRYYGAGTPNENDYHTAYYGLITAAYIIE